MIQQEAAGDAEAMQTENFEDSEVVWWCGGWVVVGCWGCVNLRLSVVSGGGAWIVGLGY